MAKTKNEEKIHQYNAFISYSRKDKSFAEEIEKALESYKPPKDLAAPQQHLNIFRDEGDMTGTEYFLSIEEHLKNSAKLIVICSPGAYQSKYVNDEIRRFTKINSPENIIPIIIQGIPNNEAKSGQEGELAFPEALCEIMEIPLAADYRGYTSGRDKVKKGGFQSSWYMVLANIYNVSRNEIEQRDQKRQRRWRNIAISVTSGVMAALLALTLWALNERQIAEKKRREAVAHRLATEARTIIDNPKAQFELGTRLLHSTLLGIESLKSYPTPQGIQILSRALNLTAKPYLHFQAWEGAKVFISNGGRRVLATNYDESIGDSYSMVRVWDVDKKQEIAHLELQAEDFGGIIFKVALSGDGKRVAIGGDFQTLSVRKVQDGQELFQPPGTYSKGGTRYNFCLSCTGKWIVIGASNKMLRMWNVDTGQKLGEKEVGKRIWEVTLSCDDRLIATEGDDKTLQVWEVETMRELARLTYEENVDAITFASSSKWLTTVDLKGTVTGRLWQPQDLINSACSSVSRNFSTKEWGQYFPDEPPRPTCDILSSSKKKGKK